MQSARSLEICGRKYYKRMFIPVKILDYAYWNINQKPCKVYEKKRVALNSGLFIFLS